MATLTSLLRRFSFIGFLPLLVAGCRFDPATDHVHSDARPENVYRADTWWIPNKLPGLNDEWFFVPESAAVVAGDTPYRQNLSVDVLVNGKVWRCTKDTDGHACFYGPINPPDVPPSTAMIVSCGVCIGFAVIGVFSLLGAGVKLMAANATANENANKERDLTIREGRLSDAQKALDRARQEDQQRQAATAEALRAEREQFEQLRNTHLAAVRETKIEQSAPTQAEWKTLSEAVRAHQFRGRATGQGLIVDYFFDPKTSGALTFNWTVNWDRPYTPTLVVCRDGKEIRRETGMFNGEFGSQLLKRSQPYTFTFALFDCTEKLPNPLLIELTLPPFDAYTPEPPKPMTVEERREKREAKRRHLYQQAEQLVTDPQKLKAAKAEIDHEIMQEFGEE